MIKLFAKNFLRVTYLLLICAISVSIASAQGEVLTTGLRADTGEILVRIESAKVNLTSPNRVDGYSCTIRNLSNKSVTALTMSWTLRTIRNGKESGITEQLVFNSLLHPDLREVGYGKPLAPGQTTFLSSGSTIKWDEATFLRAAASVEYVEFEDGTKFGPDHNKLASERLKLTRQGAEKYKQWVKAQYIQKNRSMDALMTMLGNSSLPPDLSVSTNAELSGAQMYRKTLLAIFKSGNAQDFVGKYFN